MGHWRCRMMATNSLHKAYFIESGLPGDQGRQGILALLMAMLDGRKT